MASSNVAKVPNLQSKLAKCWSSICRPLLANLVQWVQWSKGLTIIVGRRMSRSSSSSSASSSSPRSCSTATCLTKESKAQSQSRFNYCAATSLRCWLKKYVSKNGRIMAASTHHCPDLSDIVLSCPFCNPATKLAIGSWREQWRAPRPACLADRWRKRRVMQSQA